MLKSISYDAQQKSNLASNKRRKQKMLDKQVKSNPMSEESDGTIIKEERTESLTSKNVRQKRNDTPKQVQFAGEKKTELLRELAKEILMIVNEISKNEFSQTFYEVTFRRKYFITGNVIMKCRKKSCNYDVDEHSTTLDRCFSEELEDKFNSIPCKTYSSTNVFFSLEQKFVMKCVAEMCQQIGIKFDISPNLLNSFTCKISWWEG